MPDYEAADTSAGSRLDFATASKTALGDVGALRTLIGGSETEERAVTLLAKPKSETIDSVPLPIGGEPDSFLASERTRTVARASDAQVAVLSIILPCTSTKERSDVNDLLQFPDPVLDSDAEAKSELEGASDPVDAPFRRRKTAASRRLARPNGSGGRVVACSNRCRKRSLDGKTLLS